MHFVKGKLCISWSSRASKAPDPMHRARKETLICPGPPKALDPDFIRRTKTHQVGLGWGEYKLKSRFSLGKKSDDVLLNLEGFHHGSVPAERLPVLVEQNLERISMSLDDASQAFREEGMQSSINTTYIVVSKCVGKISIFNKLVKLAFSQFQRTSSWDIGEYRRRFASWKKVGTGEGQRLCNCYRAELNL